MQSITFIHTLLPGTTANERAIFTVIIIGSREVETAVYQTPHSSGRFVLYWPLLLSVCSYKRPTVALLHFPVKKNQAYWGRVPGGVGKLNLSSHETASLPLTGFSVEEQENA